VAYIVSQISKYLITLLFVMYTFDCFCVFRYKTEKERSSIYSRQNIYRFFMHFWAFFTLFVKEFEVKFLIYFILQELVIFATIYAYKKVYPHANRLIINNMCMLLTVGLIILGRLSFSKSVRQFVIMTVALIITSFIPFVIKKFNKFENFQWVYVGLGIVSLLVVLLFSNTVYGSKINITIASYTFQPSEYVKIIFVFAIACLLSNKPDMKRVILSAAIAAVHVLLLVASKDLGSAIIYFVVYFALLYVATKNMLYYLLGFIFGGIGSIGGYLLFSHVRNRIVAYTDPFGTIETSGYQIAQSLFAIGTGGWFGMGLGQGAPNTIPVVAADFIFSALVEELGVIFGICLVLVCLSCFIMFLNIAMKFKDMFYKLIAVGLAVEYCFQVFLTIGGVTKFIPLTGVTLPLVSYGGTSIVVTLCLFAIIQGLYISRGEFTYIKSDLTTQNAAVKVHTNYKDENICSQIVPVNEYVPDDEDIMFEKAVAEGLKLAQDDSKLYEIGNIDDFKE